MSTILPASGLTLSRTAMLFSPLVSWVGASAPLQRPRLIAGGELPAVVAPLGLLVDGLVCDPTQLANRGPVHAGHRRRQPATRRGVHERHELVGKSRHRAADADPAYVGTAADPRHPPPLGDVAVDDRPPTADLH